MSSTPNRRHRVDIQRTDPRSRSRNVRQKWTEKHNLLAYVSLLDHCERRSAAFSEVLDRFQINVGFLGINHLVVGVT
jgi:hypothetical protein